SATRAADRNRPGRWEGASGSPHLRSVLISYRPRVTHSSPLPEGEGDARSASGEGGWVSQSKLREPLTPALSPAGRGSVHAVPTLRCPPFRQRGRHHAVVGH